MKKIIAVFGTRPEAIKMAPVVNKLKAQDCNIITCVTGQHRQMLDSILELFNIKPEYDLNIMKPGQDLFDITTQILLGLRDIFRKEKPDIVLVHGDTTTSFAAALAAFYEQIKIGHVEAGLRTYNLYSPWPEEANRQLTSRIATFHFAPTLLSKQNLVNENIDSNHIYITGNTVIDSLHYISEVLKTDDNVKVNTKEQLLSSGISIENIEGTRPFILITGHRRENFGEGFKNICLGIKQVAEKFPTIDFIYPMHLNPNVRKPIEEIFGTHKDRVHNVHFTEPIDYLPFVMLMSKAYIIMTDSGGIQEEAPSLGKPVLVMRDTTERPEAVEAGTVKLVGTSIDKIVNELCILIQDKDAYALMSHACNPYGDGQSAERITNILLQ
ncbi:MAG: non-hydrolyzing UDP-N-acetylglucosamine 2-epimerase [Marinifilaceae bacterium]